MARFGSGLYADPQVVRAAEQATAQALAPLAGRTPDLVCVFACTPDPDDFAAVCERVVDLTGAKAVLGATTSGALGGGRGVESAAAVSVWVGLLPGVSARTFHLEVMSLDKGLAVVGLPDRRADDEVAMLLVEPASFPVDSFVDRLNAQMPGLPLVGAVAGSALANGAIRLLHDGRVVDRGAVGAFLGGPVAAKGLVAQGCRPVGPPMTVTAAERNAVLTLAGVPAAAKLEAIVASLPPHEQALTSRGLLLGVIMDEYADEHDSGDFLVRSVLGPEDNGGVLLDSVIGVGQTVQLHVIDAAVAGEQLQGALDSLLDDGSFDDVEGALLFSCERRASPVFGATARDVDRLSTAFGGIAVGGMLSDGEIGPVGARNYLHSYAASILAFGSGQAASRGTKA
jgi:small ligand-binding sensory domain FIST